MRRASQQLSYFEVYMCCLRLGCDVKIVDPLDRVTAHLHLFRHSTGPPDEPDQPTPDAQALGPCPNARAEEKKHLHLFIMRAELQVQMMQSSLKDSIEHVQSGPFKPGFINTSPGHVTNWILPGKWNQSPHLQTPRWKRLRREAGRAWHLDPATQHSDLGLSLCGHSKQVGSGKMSLLHIHGVLQKESILEHHLSSPNK